MKFLFYRPINIVAKDDKICFWSDTHFGHRCEHWERPLWKTRGFSSIEEHDEELIKRWNEVSTPNTIFFHLGDFIFGKDSIERFRNIIRRVNFKELYSMPGNHCSGWKQVFEDQKHNVWDVQENKRVIFLPNYIELIVNGQAIVASHYPVLSFNGQASRGKTICLYGHVHGNLIKNEIGKLYAKARTLEVSIESCPSPITFGEIRKIFSEREPITFDHHAQNE
jgi:calcineurin-like phosphoesterase family protein